MSKKTELLKAGLVQVLGEEECCVNCVPGPMKGWFGKEFRTTLSRTSYEVKCTVDVLRMVGIDPDALAEHIRKRHGIPDFGFYIKDGSFGACLPVGQLVTEAVSLLESSHKGN